MTTPRTLLSIPVWDQNDDPLPDGEQDLFHSTDCGEECAAMRIWYRTGIELPAGIIRRLIPGHQDHGETSPAELVRVMRIFNLTPTALPVRPTALQSNVSRAIAEGIPPLILGTWLSSSAEHYILGVAADPLQLTYNDPWDGKRKELSWRDLTRLYTGWCIV